MLDRILLEAAAGSALRLSMALAILGGLVGLGLRLAPPSGDSPQARRRLLLALACGLAIYQGTLRSLAFVGLATGTLALALLSLGLVLLLREARLGGLARLEPRADSRGLFLLGLVPLSMALSPAVSWDALIYHLRVPERTLATGFWGVDPSNVHTFFPLASSTLYLPALAVDGSGSVAQLLHLAFFLLSLTALVELAEDLAPSTGRSAALIYAAVPAGLIEAGWAWTDHTLVFSLLAAGLAVRARAPLPGFLALGLAASLKYTGLAFSAPLAIALVARCRRQPVSALAGAAALGALVSAPWYVANWLSTANPTYPLLASVFGGDPGPGESLSRWAAAENDGGWLSYALHPRSLDSDLGGPVLLALAAAGLVWGLLRRETRETALVVLFGLATLIPFQPNARVLLPALAGCALLAADLLRAGSGRLQILRFLPGLLLARGLLVAAGHDALFFGPLPCALGIESHQAYLRRNLPMTPLFERAASLAPAARVASVDERRLFRFPLAASASTPGSPPVLAVHLAARQPEGVLRSLRAAGFTHVLATSDALKGRGASVEGLSTKEAALQAEALTRCRPVDREGSLWLLEIPRAARPGGGEAPEAR